LNTYTTSTLTNGQSVDVIVTGANGCSATSAAIVNLVNQLPFYYISSPATCSSDLTTYSLAIAVGSGISVSSTSGTVTYTGSNVWTITDVPSGTNITVTITDGSCESILVVTAPNCSCPVIPAPVSGGDRSYCESGIIPAINASVSAGETIDWFSSSSGGTPLLSGSLSYTPLTAGTYYARARNVTTGCVSSTRTPVEVIMNPLPIPALSSTDPDNNFCAGTSVTFTASGGINYNFRVAGVGVQNSTSTTYTSTTLTNGQIVDVIVTNTYGCMAASAGIANTVNIIPAPDAGAGGC
jgi:hypothetical protein